MSGQIIDLHKWFETPPGRYLLAWEQAQFDHAVADIFGYHALQLGVPEIEGLRTNRMPHRWLAVADPAQANLRPRLRGSLITDFAALPFSANSLDLVVLPHSLELSADPHATLREVERVLVPEGRVVICGLNPSSLWGMRQRRAHLYRHLGFGQLFLPEAGEFIGFRRMRDWLRLLSFEIEVGQFGCYRPPWSSEKWLSRSAWMEQTGERWWPVLGAVYFLVAVRRVRGMHLIGKVRKERLKTSAAPAVATTHRRR